MKLRTQLTLLLVGAACVAVLAMGAFFAVNLERGFVGYVNAVQQRHFEALVQAATQLAERPEGIQTLLRDRRLWMRLVRETEGGIVPGDLANWRGTADARPPREPRDARPDDSPRGIRPYDAPPGKRDRFDDRPPKGRRPPGGAPADSVGVAGNAFLLLDSVGTAVFQESAPAGRRASIDRDIVVDGKVVARVRHHPFERLSRAEDLAFLQRQFIEAALVGLAVLLLVVVAAPAIARRWTRPLRETAAATERIARGEFGVRTEPRGADEIAAVMMNVNAMAKALAAMDAARKRWIAEIAHELRTPLMALRGEVDAMQDGVRPMDARALHSLNEETRRLTRLVEDLHLLTVADMEGVPCVPVRFDPAESLRFTVDRLRPRAGERGLQLQAALPAGPLALLADRDRFEQLLGNLLENSLRYTDAPGRIDVALERLGDGIRLCVDDSAPGVMDHERIFEPLYRADPARSRREGGSGLGLSIVRAIVQAHRGRVTAGPSSLGGLRVVVELPGR